MWRETTQHTPCIGCCDGALSSAGFTAGISPDRDCQQDSRAHLQQSKQVNEVWRTSTRQPKIRILDAFDQALGCGRLFRDSYFYFRVATNLYTFRTGMATRWRDWISTMSIAFVPCPIVCQRVRVISEFFLQMLNNPQGGLFRSRKRLLTRCVVPAIIGTIKMYRVGHFI